MQLACYAGKVSNESPDDLFPIRSAFWLFDHAIPGVCHPEFVVAQVGMISNFAGFIDYPACETLELSLRI